MVRPGRVNPFTAAAVVEAEVGEIYEDMAFTAIQATFAANNNNKPRYGTQPQAQPLTADTMTANLRGRLVNGDCYTSIGGRVMVAINPNRPLSVSSSSGSSSGSSDSLSKAHATWSKSTDPSKWKKRRDLLEESGVPTVHVFDMSANAYFHMSRGQEDQTILLIYTEFQFDTKGKMVGAKYLDYLLERTRVTGAEDGGRSFNIFYQLLGGATHEEKQQWQLGDSAHYHYLNVSRFRVQLPNDTTALSDLRENLKSVGIGNRHQTQLFQLLAAILHLVFLDARAAAEQRDSFARSLYAVAFAYIVEQINKKLCQPEQEWSNFIAILDTPGFSAGFPLSSSTRSSKRASTMTNPELSLQSQQQQVESIGVGFNRLLVNFANEKILAFANSQLFDLPRNVLASEDLPAPPETPSKTVSQVLGLFEGVGEQGILPILDAEAAKGSKDSKTTEKIHAELSTNPAFSTPTLKKLKYSFGVRHTFGSIVEYDTKGFADANTDVLQSDFVTLIRGSPEQPGTSNPFLRALFSDRMIATLTHSGDKNTVVAAQAKVRHPSLKRSKRGEKGAGEDEVDPAATCGHQFRASLSELLETVGDTQTWFIYHIRQSEDITSTTSKFDSAAVKRQVEAFELPTISKNPAVVYTAALRHADFLQRFANLLSPMRLDQFGASSPRAQCENLIRGSSWSSSQARNGKTRIFIAETEWRSLEDRMRSDEEEARRIAGGDTRSNYGDSEVGSAFGDGGVDTGDEMESNFELEFSNFMKKKSDGSVLGVKVDTNVADIEMKALNEASKGGDDEEKGVKKAKEKPVKEKKRKMSKTRFRWLVCVWCTTWWIPWFCLSMCKMKRKDRQIAFREKFTLVWIIVLMNAFILFFIVGLNFILCPKTNVLSPGEVSGNNKANGGAMVYMYGRYYSAHDSFVNHGQYGASANIWQNAVLGQDVSEMFDKSKFWNNYCTTYSQPQSFLYTPETTDARLNDGTWSPHMVEGRDDKFQQMNPYIRGTVVWDTGAIQGLIASNRRIVVAYDRIYDVSAFYRNNYKDNFLGNYFQQTFDVYGVNGQDATSVFNFIKNNNYTQWSLAMPCMDGLFYIGNVDHRTDLKCVVPNYILLAASIILVLIIGFKFVAALQFGNNRLPEDHDKFVICQVPCYTEGEVSLTRTIQSLATLQYDDKHKLICIIADGMIIGSGNDRPTPRIVLDILGVDPSVDPESFAFESLGEGNKQHNCGKIYAGLYEVFGHLVPFIVIVKVGKPSERQRPGNRGKRDSQMIMMRFLSRVHFNQAMNPLELELYHQMKNVIGVDPSYYEFILSIDADTEVFNDSLNLLVSSMARDSKIIGICGETQLGNEKDSWVTMVQVYEYFISHHLAKAFESLFGSVTCLPGCFSMFRIRTAQKNIPLLVSPGIIADYSENNVDTLHLKNLLHLGEDRYLTTLLMKHFPQMRTNFTPDAKCKTNAPDKFNILLSQRRRWINSTVHNLLELLILPELCGFCCFDMRFVVFVDLFATLVQPAALIYIAYLIYASITGMNANFPLISIVMIAAIYGFQIIIFLIKREWQHVGWMIIYILAIPFFAFYIPLYAFWHFDDFSWGNTRLVVEDGQMKEVDVEDDPFDPSQIPKQKWVDYEQERHEKMELQSEYSYKVASVKGPGSIYGTPVYNLPPPTVYGGGSVYMASSPGSIYAAGSVYGGPPVPIQVPIHPASVYEGSVYSGFMPGPGAVEGSITGSPIAGQRVSMVSQSPSMVAGRFPTDEEILAYIRHILSTADLMTVTRKIVREELTRHFGVDLSSKKQYIHSCIDAILRGEM
ncbi:hypothetical protein HDU76_007573 [Blyttiomyces sp. JEL0837]|nr:hypothetical protein HDU76_007573 [Blyttiomyces sp. JEL0837]